MHTWSPVTITVGTSQADDAREREVHTVTIGVYDEMGSLADEVSRVRAEGIVRACSAAPVQSAAGSDDAEKLTDSWLRQKDQFFDRIRIFVGVTESMVAISYSLTAVGRLIQGQLDAVYLVAAVNPLPGLLGASDPKERPEVEAALATQRLRYFANSSELVDSLR